MSIGFNSSKWLSGDWRVRGSMVDSLKADSLLIGMTKSEVLKILGDPTGSDTSGESMVYVVDIDSKWRGDVWPFFFTVHFDTMTNIVNDVWCRD